MSIKEFLKNTLKNPELLSLTGDKKVHFLHAKKPIPPYIEYQIVDSYGEDWAEGEEISTTHVVQVDIFSKTDYSDLEEIIRNILKTAGFIRANEADLYEENTELYHKAMRFNYTEEV